MSISSVRRLATSFASAACIACWLLTSTALGQGTYNWNTTSGTWDLSAANWTGAGTTWVNGTSSNAVFNNVSATITLTEAITAGTLSFNWNGYNGSTRSPVLTGSTLSVASIAVNGIALGGGVNSIGEAYNERAAISNTTNVTGNATVTRGMLYALNGTLNVSGTIRNADAWSVFRADSSTVTAAGGIDFSVLASQVELYGGTVTTPFIKVGNGASWGLGGLFLGNGVTLVATGDSNDFIQVFNDGNTGSRAAATLASGGANIDTSYAVTIATQLVGGGSFTKSGTGTLTLTKQNNTYTGGTIVNQGTLVLAAGAWTLSNDGGGGGGAVTVGNGATLTADNSVANQLAGLTLNGGTVNAINSAGNSDWGNFFLAGNVTATGTSSLNADIALRASNVDFNVAAGGTLNVGGVMHNGANYGIYSGSPATVSKSGSGTMVLSGANTYTGATTVNAGTLTYQNTYASTSHSIASGAVLELNVASGSRDSAATTFSGSGTLRKTGAGSIVWGSGVATFNLGAGSLIDVQSGTFTGGSWGNDVWTNNLSDLNVASGASFDTVEANVRVNAITGGGTIRTGFSGGGYQNLTVGVNNGGSTFSGVIADSYAAGNLVKSGTGTITLTGSNTYTGATTISSGRLELGGAGQLGGGSYSAGISNSGAFVVSTSANQTLSGAITGTGSLTKNGTGTLSLAGSNTYSGGTTLSAGVIAVGNDSALGSGTLSMTGGGLSSDGVTARSIANVLSVAGDVTLGNASNTGALSFTSGVNLGGATRQVATPSNVIFAGPVTSGGLTKTGAGTLTLSAGSNDFGLGTTVSAGMLAVAGAGGLGTGAVDVSGGVLAVTGTGSVGSGLVTLNSGVILVGNDGALGALTVTLNGGRLSSGDSSARTLGNAIAIGGDVSLGGVVNTGGLTLGAGGIALGSAVRQITVDSAVTFAGPVTNGGLTKTGVGTLTLSASNSYAGGTTLNQGTLAFANGGLGSTGSVALAASTVLRWAAGNTEDVSSRLVLPNSGAATVDVQGNDVTFAGGFGSGATGGLTKTGAGTLTIAGTAGYTGVTTVSTGTLAVTTANGIAASSQVSVASVAALDVSGASGVVNVGAIAGSGNVVLGGNTLRSVVASGDTTFGGVISGSGGFTKAGAGGLTISQAQAFTGRVTVEDGTLSLGLVGDGGDSLFQSASSILVGTAAGSSATLDASTWGLTIVTGQKLGGHGTVNATGGGNSLIMSAGSILSPGNSVGHLSTLGNLTLSGSSRYTFEVNDATGTAGVSPGWDLMSATGSLTLAASGTNRIILDLVSLTNASSGTAANFNPAAGYAWKFAVAGSEITSFDPGWFQIDTTNFLNLPGSPERFSVVLGGSESLAGDDNQALYLVYAAAVPEPGTLAMAGIGVACAAFLVRRRVARGR